MANPMATGFPIRTSESRLYPASGQGNQFDSFRDSTRIQGFVDLYADDIWDEDSLVTKILGNLKLTGLWQERRTQSTGILLAR